MLVIEKLQNSGTLSNEELKSSFLGKRVVFNYNDIKVGGVIVDFVLEDDGFLYMFIIFDRAKKINGQVETGSGFTDGDEVFNFGNLTIVE